jgi:hypothetical protein
MALAERLTMLAFLPLLLAAQAEPPREASSYERIGKTIAMARVCDAFGFALDRQGLADWAAASRDALARRDARFTSDEAQLEIERHVVSSFVHDYRAYWGIASRDGRAADEFIDIEYRYHHLQRKACRRLARSEAVGRFISPPEEAPDASEVVTRVREEFSRIRLER